MSALVAGVREAAGHPSGPQIAADTGLATRAGHQPSGRRSFRKQRTVNPPIARYNFLYLPQGRPSAGGRLWRPSSRRQRHDGYPEAGLAERCRLEVRSRS